MAPVCDNVALNAALHSKQQKKKWLELDSRVPYRSRDRVRVERWLALALRTTSLRNFGNSVYPALPVSFGGDTKIHRSLLSGARPRAQGK